MWKRKGGFWKYHLSTFAIISIFKRLKLRTKTERVWGIGVCTGISSVQQKDSDKNVMNNLYLVNSEVWNKVRGICMEYHICYWIYPVGWPKVWSNSNFVFLVGEMWPFLSQITTLKSGNDQIKFTHDRHPPYIPLKMHRKDSGLAPFLCFIMGKGVGWRSWVNFIWSSPDFRAIICGGNGHISLATKTKFEFVHTFSHPKEQWGQKPYKKNE